MGHKADFNKTSLSGGNAVYFACKSVTLNLSYVLADILYWLVVFTSDMGR